MVTTKHKKRRKYIVYKNICNKIKSLTSQYFYHYKNIPKNKKEFCIYIFRWIFISTPIMLLIMYPLEYWLLLPVIFNLPIGQLFGGIVLYSIDCIILKNKVLNEILRQGELWQIKENIICYDCNIKATKGYRLVFKDLLENTYDKTTDKNPEFRCWKCAISKYKNKCQSKY